MAIYMLEVGESEQHTHRSQTTTELLEGHADLIMEAGRITLAKNIPVIVPPDTPHIVVNTGRIVAACRCNC